MIRHPRTPAPPPTEPSQSKLKRYWHAVKSKVLSLEFNWQLFSIDEQLPLHKHMLFWWPIAIFLFLSLALTTPFWCTCWPNPNEYEVLLKQLGFPLLIASFAIPISVAVGRFHASKQRARTNELTIENNAFNNFFSHRNHFMDYAKASGIPKEYEGFIEVSDVDLLYKTVFPKNAISEQNYRINPASYKAGLQRKLEKLFKHINEFIIEVETQKHERSEEEFMRFVRQMPSAFGLEFAGNIASFYDKYDKKKNETFFSLCFLAIKDTLQSMHAFNHIQTVGLVIEIEFKPLIDSLDKNQALRNADSKAMEYLVWALATEPHS